MREKRDRKPRRITPDYLERAALFYLQRYSSSSGNLKFVLQRKVWSAARESEIDQEEARSWIDDVVAKIVRAGLLDDRKFAETRVLSLRRSGESTRSIRLKLAAKGVEGDLVEHALQQDELENDELTAAIAYARKRRLGPFHTSGKREELQEKDLAALARRGFRYETCRLVIEARDERALEVLLDERF